MKRTVTLASLKIFHTGPLIVMAQETKLGLFPQPKLKSEWNMNLVPGVLAHVKPPHPHVRQQHLGAGVSHEGPQVRRHRQLQAGGVAPVLQLVGQQLHGHGLVLAERLLQQVHGQRAELSAKGYSALGETKNWQSVHRCSKTCREDTHVEYSLSSSDVSSTTSLFLAS